MTDYGKRDIRCNSRQQPPQGCRRRLWLPTLLFGDGLMLAVILMAMIMLRRFGSTKTEAMLYTSLLCLPLVLRPLLETVVTYFRGTTKVWILSSEFISALSLCALAFILPTGYRLQGTLCFLMFFVIAGVFGSIAVERFYLSGSQPRRLAGDSAQTLFRSLAVLFGIGMCATLAGNMEVVTRNIRYSWSFVVYVMAGVEFFLWLWHSVFLPGGRRAWAGGKDLKGVRFHDFTVSFMSLLREKKSRQTLVFFFLFVLPEAFLALMSPLFMVDAAHNGGLGLAPQEFGLAFGTVGIMAFFFGKKLGLNAVRRFSLRRVMLPAALLMSLHGVMMLCLSYNLSASFALICLASFVGYAAFGLGMAVLSVTMRQYSMADCALLRRAVALSVVSMAVVLTGFFVGFMQEEMGYCQFFGVSAVLYAAPLVAAMWYVKGSKGFSDNKG